MSIPTASKGEPERLFPEHVFHPDLQAVIRELGTHGFNAELTATVLLSILAASIGTSYQVQGFEPDHNEPCILWAVLVAKSGTKKSAITRALRKPLEDHHWKLISQYEADKENYDSALQDERAHLRKPRKQEIWIRGFTIEGVVKAAESTPKGSLIYSDEFLSFISNLNKYNKGNDLDIILGFHDGEGYSSTLATKDGSSVRRTNLNILGGIQWRRLPSLLTKENLNSGFAHRILFAAPDISIPYPTDTAANEAVRNRYSEIIQALLDIEPEAGIITLSEEARKDLYRWLCHNTDLKNDYNRTGSILSEVYSKAEGTLLRLALILQVSFDICNKSKPAKISSDQLHNAIDLIEFYLQNTIRLYGLDGLPEELMGKPDWQVKLYKLLPQDFTTQEAVDLASVSVPIKGRSVKDFLANHKLFKRINQGNYRKVI